MRRPRRPIDYSDEAMRDLLDHPDAKVRSRADHILHGDIKAGSDRDREYHADLLRARLNVLEMVGTEASDFPTMKLIEDFIDEVTTVTNRHETGMVHCPCIFCRLARPFLRKWKNKPRWYNDGS